MNHRCQASRRFERPQEKRAEMRSLKKLARSAAATSRRTSPRFCPSVKICVYIACDCLSRPQPCVRTVHSRQRQQNAARQFSGTAGILRESQFQAAQNCGDGLAALLRGLQSRAHFAQPYFAKRVEQLFFAREIIEKGPFPYIGSLRDFFDGGVLKALPRHQMHGRVKKPLAHGGGMAFPARERPYGRRIHKRSGIRARSFHLFRPLVNSDYKSVIAVCQAGEFP